MLSDHPLNIPRFKPQFTVAQVHQQALLIQSEARRTLLNGHALSALAGLINGQRCVAEISEALAPDLSSIEVAFVLDHLERAGYISACPAEPRDEQAFWDLLGHAEAAPRLTQASLALVSLGADDRAVRHAVQQASLRITPEADLTLLVCDDYLRPAVADYVLAARGPVLLAKPVGTQPTIGPWLSATTPGPCWHCLAHALRWNRPVQQFIARHQSAYFPVPAPPSGPGSGAAAGLLAMASARVLLGDARLRSAVLSINLDTLQTTHHSVRQRPQCPHCGDAAFMSKQAATPPQLHSVRIAHPTDGGHRSISPQQTVAAYRSLISPLTGVVNYLHPMPGRHSDVRKVYVSGYQVCPQELPHDNAFDKICAGKGQSDDQAQASALCEALERASSVWQGDEPMRHTSRANLGDAAISFDCLQGFSARQFAQRDSINAGTHDRRRQVPLPFDDAAQIAWTPAWSLVSGQQHWVPLAYCYAETPPELGRAYGIYNPNGTAAGNGLEEAVLQGLLELIERDATAIWWYNRLARPEVDLTEFSDPYFARIQADYAASGWRLRVLDLSHDLGIAVCAALGFHAGLNRHAIGFGCHLQPRLAVSRALTELNQLLDMCSDAPPPWDSTLLPRASFLSQHAGFSRLPQGTDGQDLKLDIAHCINRLAASGHDALVVNKTRPDIGLSVAQIIVPGLRHFWPRFGPGRLYEVPVRMGWSAKAQAEEELNPAPLFL